MEGLRVRRRVRGIESHQMDGGPNGRIWRRGEDGRLKDGHVRSEDWTEFGWGDVIGRRGEHKEVELLFEWGWRGFKPRVIFSQVRMRRSRWESWQVPAEKTEFDFLCGCSISLNWMN